MEDRSPSRALFEGLRDDGEQVEPVRDWLSVEAPLQIRINGRPFTVTMRTPGDDPHLVRGLLFTEGVVEPAGLAFDVSFRTDPRLPGSTLAEATIPAVYVCETLLENRSLVSSASCGICGVRELDDIEIHSRVPAPDYRLPLDRVPGMAETMYRGQTAFRRTGGCHGAAGFTRHGDMLALFEDIGRHNAVDKVVGSLLDEDLLGRTDLLFVSGRVSFEIVAKACRARIPFLAGVSAPSSLAVQMADRHGVTLLGYCRAGRATVYSHADRVAHLEPRRA